MLAVLGVQAVVDFVFVAVPAGNQQVLAERQELLGTRIGAALGQFGENARFRQVWRGDGRQRQQAFAQGIAYFILAQAAAAAGAQHRVADQRQVRVGGQQLGHGVDHVDRAKHAQLDRGNRGVGQYGVSLGQHPLAVEYPEVGNIDGILHGQGSHGGCRVTALGAATWVVAGETEDNGAGAVGIHGRRAYHQTCLGESSDKPDLLIEWSAYGLQLPSNY